MSTEPKETSVLTFFVAHLIEQRRDRQETWRAIGDDWGVTHPTLHAICGDLAGVGPDVELRLADKLTHGSRDELDKRAKAWRKANPHWLPRDYVKKHPSTSLGRPNKSYPWWNAQAELYLKEHAQFDWAVWAAGERPRRDPEPRQERRANYVDREVEDVLDLPEEEQQRFENAFRHLSRTVERSSGTHTAAPRHK